MTEFTARLKQRKLARRSRGWMHSPVNEEMPIDFPLVLQDGALPEPT